MSSCNIHVAGGVLVLCSVAREHSMSAKVYRSGREHSSQHRRNRPAYQHTDRPTHLFAYSPTHILTTMTEGTDKKYTREEAEAVSAKLSHFFAQGSSKGPYEVAEEIRSWKTATEMEVDCFLRSKFSQAMFSTLLQSPHLRKNYPLPRTNQSIQATRIMRRKKKKKATNEPRLNYKEQREKEREETKKRIKEMFSLPPYDIDDFVHHDLFSKELSFELCHHLAGGEGSTGVYLLAYKKGLFTLKPGNLQSAGEYFCYLLFTKLKLPVPKMHVIKEKGYELIYTAIRATEGTSREVERRLRLYFKTDFAIISEFIPSQSLYKIGKLLATRNLSVSSVLTHGTRHSTYTNRSSVTSVTQLGSRNREIFNDLLFQLGEVLSIDIIINNGDRIPFFHRGDGNPGNILLRKPVRKGLCFIDNSISAIAVESSKNSYLNRVRRLTNELFNPAEQDLSMEERKTLKQRLDQVHNFLKAAMNVDLEVDEAAMNVLISGIKNGFKKCKDLMKEDEFAIAKLKQQTINAFLKEDGTLGLAAKQGLESVDPMFIADIIKAVNLE